MSLPILDPVVWADADEVRDSRRLWAVVMLTSDLEVCRSILVGRPVLARQLDAEALRRARRSEPLLHLTSTSASGTASWTPSPRAAPSN